MESCPSAVAIDMAVSGPILFKTGENRTFSHYTFTPKTGTIVISVTVYLH